MADLSVTALRDMARDAMLSCGARGFMRFAKDAGEWEDALLVTDAAGRCADGGAALREALEGAGLICREDGGLWHVVPDDALLERLCAKGGDAPIDWDGPLCEAQALAVRLLREPHAPLTQKGRSLALALARILWQPQGKALAALAEFRATLALRMRKGERNGFYQAGCLLERWCLEQRKGDGLR